VGNRYELTPLAAQLAEQTTSALAAVARVFASEPDFDPAAAEREFTVLISDYAISVLGPQLAALLQRAPNIRLRLHQVAIPAVNAAAQALRDVDAMVLPHGFVTGLPHPALPLRRRAVDRGAVVASHVRPGHRASLAAPAVHRSRAGRAPRHRLSGATEEDF
jgi:hypothetical protein